MTTLIEVSYAQEGVATTRTQESKDCLITFSATNEWGTIKAYYFDIEGGRGKVFFNSGERLPKGTAVTFEAKVSSEWKVGSWTVNGKNTKGRTRTRLDIYVEEDSDIALTCERLKQYKISYESEPIEGGTIKVYWKKQTDYYGYEFEKISIPSGGAVVEKTKIYVEAIPKDGYRFDRYVINGKSQTGDTTDKNMYETTPSEDLTIRGVFISTRPTSYAIHFAQPTHGRLQLFAGEEEVKSESRLEQGTEIRAEVTADEGYELKSLKANDLDILSAKKFTLEGETTIVATIEQNTGLKGTMECSHIVAYPNPTDRYYHLALPTEVIGSTAYIIDMDGNIVLTLPLEQHEKTLDLETLPVGIYLFTISGANQALTIIRK